MAPASVRNLEKHVPDGLLELSHPSCDAREFCFRSKWTAEPSSQRQQSWFSRLLSHRRYPFPSVPLSGKIYHHAMWNILINSIVYLVDFGITGRLGKQNFCYVAWTPAYLAIVVVMVLYLAWGGVGKGRVLPTAIAVWIIGTLKVHLNQEKMMTGDGQTLNNSRSQEF